MIRHPWITMVMVLMTGWGTVSFARAEDNPGSPKTAWGSIDLGLQYVGWSASYAAPDNGSELLIPLTLTAVPWKGAKIYAQAQFTNGNYTSPAAGEGTFNLTALTDTVVGFQTNLKSFDLPSLFNVGFNIPTGDPTWETKQGNSIVPTQFISGDYRGRGFGMSFLYALSLPAGTEQYGVAGGYMYSGAFNPAYGDGVPAEQLKLGDSFFLSVNHFATHGDGQSDVVRLSAFYFLPTLKDSSNLLQMGPNLNLSYGWNNPRAFSFEVGGQYFFPTLQANGGQLTQEPNNSIAPRFYLNPSYAFGDLSIAGRLKYILPNGYPSSDVAHYDGGGFTAGLEPTLRFKLDSSSALRVSAGYDYVVFKQMAVTLPDLSQGRADIEYGHWTFGTHYEVNW